MGMGRQLYDTQPTFRQTLDHCADLLAPHMDRPLLEVMFTADTVGSRLQQTVYTQPALFSLEYSLAQWWMALGGNGHECAQALDEAAVVEACSGARDRTLSCCRHAIPF